MSEKMSSEEKEKMAKAFEKILKEDDKVSGGGFAVGIGEAIANKSWGRAGKALADLAEEVVVSGAVTYGEKKLGWI